MPPRFNTALAAPYLRFLARIAFLFMVAAHPTLLLSQTGTHDVHSVFVVPTNGGKSDALSQRVSARLRQSGAVRLVNGEKLADAVLHIDAVFWPIGSMTLNPRSQSGTFTNYQGYASADLTAPSGQVLWSYLATPRRFKFAGIVDNLADQIGDRLLITLKTGLAVAPAAGAATAGTPGAALHAAGATFPAPLYMKWFQSFAEQSGSVPIVYDAVGSVKGLDELAAGKVEIAASDIPPPAASSTTGINAAGSNRAVLRFPSVAGGIVPIYNLTGGNQAGARHGAAEQIDLTGDILADIYSGKITRWNDRRIRALNSGAHLPDEVIAVIHRSDGSGTTFAWTSYLALASPDWTNRAGATVDWPIGTGVAGNGGVADAVAKTPYSIGYVEFTYAIQHHLAFAGVRNASGRFVRASLDSISAAAQSHGGGTALGGTILNSPEKEAYPIATFTWLVIPPNSPDVQKRASIKRFLQWMLVDGQRQCSELGYAPLPRDLVREEQRVLDGLN